MNDEATNKQKKKKKKEKEEDIACHVIGTNELVDFRFEVLYRSDFYLDDLTPTSRALLLNDSVDEPLLLAFRVG